MTPRKNKLKEIFEKLMNMGIQISRNSQEGDAIYRDINQLDESFRDFNIWKIEIINFVKLAKLNKFEGYKLFESDSVPMLKGGLEYGDINSKKSQELLKNIRLETSKKLEILKELNNYLLNKESSKAEISERSEVDVIEVIGKKVKFSFNKKTGSIIFNEQHFNFPPKQQKFIIIKIIVTSTDKQGLYKTMYDELKIPIGKTSNRTIQSLIKEIKKDLKILPKTRRSLPDIFKSVPRIGYRLNLN